MNYVPSGAPFSERGGRWRGVIDVLAGRYPPFVFGFGIGSLLPVFHFHETTPEQLEPAFQYLVDNGYATVGCDEMAAVVRRGTRPTPRTVLLAFDDALASVWLVAAPLLRRYGLTAVTYAIPGRIDEASAVRPTIDDGPVDAVAADASTHPFATWPELRALAQSGIVEVQSHSWSHSMQFCGAKVIGVVQPAEPPEHFLNRPRLNADDPPVFLDPSRYGHPLFARRSRLSDAHRYFPDEAACERVERLVGAGGGAAFFDRPDWSDALAGPLSQIGGRWEREADQRDAIAHELRASREVLEARLGAPVRHLCLPWGVMGRLTRSLVEQAGYETAVANRLSGMYAVRHGDDPYFLKRLPNRHIFALPGRGRRRPLQTLA
jgi:peptidoglycan/xylan/chitin deacetylase (PgdA/CDA1 family)